jgi:diguanylate cyclase (GGDEF)-like protein/PAS domain S-box-containing protein
MDDLLQFLYLAPVGMVKFNAAGMVDLMNPAAASLLQAIAPGGALTDIYRATSRLLPDLADRITRFAAPAGAIIDQLRLESSAAGRPLVISLTVNRVGTDVYMAVLQDVTLIAQQESLLFADRAKFRAIFEHLHDFAIYTLTPDGIIEAWNHSLESYAGWQAQDVVGRPDSMFFPPDDPTSPNLATLLAEARRAGFVEFEGWRLQRDGSLLWARSTITALPDIAGILQGFFVVSRDRTQSKRAEDDMKLLATVDALTGAYNRRQAEVLIAAEFSRCARGALPFAVLMIDIDHFKQVNDRFGHAAGDAVLRALVRECQATLRTIDVVARWGGEEFLLLLPSTSTAQAMIAGERVRAAIEAAATAYRDTAPIRVTVSIGAATLGDEIPAELIRRADTALYAAKAAGRNRVILAAAHEKSASDMIL